MGLLLTLEIFSKKLLFSRDGLGSDLADSAQTRPAPFLEDPRELEGKLRWTFFLLRQTVRAD